MGVLPGAGTFYFEGSDVGCLLIHGFTGTPQNIRPLGDFLPRRGLTVLAPRPAGHGTTVDDFENAIVPASIGQRVLEMLTAAPDKRLVELGDSAHEATLDLDLERIGLEWLSFVRQYARSLVGA
jgi:hypothetical protein